MYEGGVVFRLALIQFYFNTHTHIHPHTAYNYVILLTKVSLFNCSMYSLCALHYGPKTKSKRRDNRKLLKQKQKDKLKNNLIFE